MVCFGRSLVVVFLKTVSYKRSKKSVVIFSIVQERPPRKTGMLEGALYHCLFPKCSLGKLKVSIATAIAVVAAPVAPSLQSLGCRYLNCQCLCLSCLSAGALAGVQVLCHDITTPVAERQLSRIPMSHQHRFPVGDPNSRPSSP